MRKLLILILAAAMVFSAGASYASSMGAVSTDRFGYTGTITRYQTYAEAVKGSNAVDTISVGNRDLSVYTVNGLPAYGGDFNAIMGSWWYTTMANTNGLPKDDPNGDRYYSGWGNTAGNTGIGFMQLYDNDGSTDTFVDYSFGGFDGTYWTEFSLFLSGGDAPNASDYSRLSATKNTGDAGTWLEYELAFAAYGLEGQETSPGLIEATNHATGVGGYLYGIFENTSTSDPAQNGFYVVDFGLNMENWAFAQGNEALNGDFDDSYFAAQAPSAVPIPGAVWLLGSGLIGVFGWRRKAQA